MKVSPVHSFSDPTIQTWPKSFGRVPSLSDPNRDCVFNKKRVQNDCGWNIKDN